jgi:hypothetical protein
VQKGGVAVGANQHDGIRQAGRVSGTNAAGSGSAVGCSRRDGTTPITVRTSSGVTGPPRRGTQADSLADGTAARQEQIREPLIHDQAPTLVRRRVVGERSALDEREAQSAEIARIDCHRPDQR